MRNGRLPILAGQLLKNLNCHLEPVKIGDPEITKFLLVTGLKVTTEAVPVFSIRDSEQVTNKISRLQCDLLNTAGGLSQKSVKMLVSALVPAPLHLSGYDLPQAQLWVQPANFLAVLTLKIEIKELGIEGGGQRSLVGAAKDAVSVLFPLI
jgi:hypothetical protein